MKKILGLLAFFIISLALTFVIVLYARGYRPNFEERTIEGTGIISVRSKPTEATVFLNDEEKGTTNLDISNLKPDIYTVRLQREGFSVWEKEVTVKKEAVNILEAVLFPTTPSLKALTFTGAINPLVSPSGDKIVFGVINGNKSGLWSLNLSTRQLPIFFSRDQNQIVKNTDEFDFTTSTYRFSPDGESVLVTLSDSSKQEFLFNVSETNEPNPLESSEVENILDTWERQQSDLLRDNLEPLGEEAQLVASSLKNIQFSPDITKFFGQKANGQTILYDADPTPIPDARDRVFALPKAQKYLWYSDNEHLIVVEEGKLSIVELDGYNKITIYTGDFRMGLAAPWSDGSKVVIATNLNNSTSGTPNLYAIELR